MATQQTKDASAAQDDGLLHDRFIDEAQAAEEESGAARNLFDLRVIIGGLFLVYGVYLTIRGIIDSSAAVQQAAGVRINLWTGLSALVARRRLPAVGDAAAADARRDRRGPGRERRGGARGRRGAVGARAGQRGGDVRAVAAGPLSVRARRLTAPGFVIDDAAAKGLRARLGPRAPGAPLGRSGVLIEEEAGYVARVGGPAVSAGVAAAWGAAGCVDADRRRGAVGGVSRRQAGPVEPGAAGLLRDVGASRDGDGGDVQRASRARDQRGDLPLSRRCRGSAARCSWGRDTHALSEPAAVSAVAGPRRPRRRGPGRRGRRADPDAGRLARDPHPQPRRRWCARRWDRDHPSHNPPEDGGFKYNPPTGGPADTTVTRWIQDEANRLLEGGLADVAAAVAGRGGASPHVRRHDYVGAYVGDLGAVIDMEAIRAAGVSLGRRSARRRERAVLGADRRALRARHHGRQRRDRSDVPLRAARP